MISQIKIPARWWDEGNEIFMAGWKKKTAVFNLGLGPCGKTVETLEIHYDDTFVTVTQICSDTEKKVFMYRVKDLIGRIEVTYV